MKRRAFTLLAALLVPACAAWQDPRPGPVRAMAPRPNPPAAPARTAAPEPARRAPWVTRFWEELTPAQRRLVASRLRRSPTPRAAGAAEAQASWDVMGLPEREALIAGRPTAPLGEVPAEVPPGQRAEAEAPSLETTR